MDTGNLYDPENELLSRLREGDPDSFKKIYERYRQKVYLYALKISKSDDVAEEIAQEVFIRIWEKRMQINTEMSFEGYIKKITLHHVLNHIKKVARERTLQEQVFVYIDQIRNSTEEGVYEKELIRIYHEAVDQLPPQKKLIYKMSRNEELTHDEIAEKLNISKNTVKNHMVEATKFIRSSVNKHGSIICFLMAATNYFHRN